MKHTIFNRLLPLLLIVGLALSGCAAGDWIDAAYLDNLGSTNLTATQLTATTANISTAFITSGNITSANMSSLNMSGDVLPTSNNTRSLGSTLIRWLTGWFVNLVSETHNTTQLNATTANISSLNISTDITPSANNTANLGSATRWFANLWVNLVTAINGVFTTVNTTQLTATTGNISQNLTVSNVTVNTTFTINGTASPFGQLGASAYVIASDASLWQRTLGNFQYWLGLPVWVADGTADEVQIQAALNALPSVGGYTIGSVELSSGTFYIANTINLTTGNNLWGSGKDATILRLSADTLMLQIGTTVLNAADVSLLNMTLDGNSKAYSTGARAVWMRASGAPGNYSLRNILQNLRITSFNATALYLEFSQDNIFKDIQLDSVGSITGNQPGIYGQGNATTEFSSNVFDGITMDGGDFYQFVLDTNARMNKIVNSKFDLSNTALAGVVILGDDNIVSNCIGFTTGGNSALILNFGGDYNIYSLNRFQSSNTTNTAGISVNGGSKNIVMGNIADGFTYGVQDAGTSTSIIGNTLFNNNGGILAGTTPLIVNNNLSNNNYVVIDSPAGTIRSNIGYVTENSGNFTITAGQWGVSQAHGLATNATAIQLTLTSNTTTTVYVSFGSITATNFTANLSVLQGGDVTGVWRAVIGAGN